ncbi:MAG: hypothetical protein R3C97_01860 [Geminicoccaceae bacterium]
MDRVETIVANRLAGTRLAGLDGMSEDEGYALQARGNARLREALGDPVGYKIGATTVAMRELLRVEQPIAGEVFEKTVRRTPAVLRHADLVSPGIETEIAVRLGRDVPPSSTSHDRESIARFVDAVMPAIEIVDNRYEVFRSAGAATFAADNNFNAGSILGAECTEWRDLPLDALQTRTFIDGELKATALSDQLMGHPLDALAWLAKRYGAYWAARSQPGRS